MPKSSSILTIVFTMYWIQILTIFSFLFKFIFCNKRMHGGCGILQNEAPWLVFIRNCPDQDIPSFCKVSPPKKAFSKPLPLPPECASRVVTPVPTSIPKPPPRPPSIYDNYLAEVPCFPYSSGSLINLRRTTLSPYVSQRISKISSIPSWTKGSSRSWIYEPQKFNIPCLSPSANYLRPKVTQSPSFKYEGIYEEIYVNMSSKVEIKSDCTPEQNKLD